MLETAIFFETPEEMYQRVYATLRPGNPPPKVTVSFCRFANANSFIKMDRGEIEVRVTDVLEGAPAPILEALAYILTAKLLRRRIGPEFTARYRRYLNRKDIRDRLNAMRQERGRKQISGPRGDVHDLDAIFDAINFQYFFGLMAKPALGWSLRASRVTLGHYDPSHHTIVISKLLDRVTVPRLAVEYVMYHEMLHVKHPVDHKGSRRCVHTPEFKLAEKQFERLKEAKALLRHL